MCAESHFRTNRQTDISTGFSFDKTSDNCGLITVSSSAESDLELSRIWSIPEMKIQRCGLCSTGKRRSLWNITCFWTDVLFHYLGFSFINRDEFKNKVPNTWHNGHSIISNCWLDFEFVCQKVAQANVICSS